MRTGFEAAGHVVRVDPLGNVIASVRPPRAGYAHVVVFAHMDEVGFIVRKIEPTGFVRVQRMGGIPEKSMAAQRLAFLGAHGMVQGVIATKAHHVTEDQEKYHVVPVKDVFVDIGAHSRDEALAAGISVGIPATWLPGFHRQGDIVHAKALDNRVGCTAVLAIANAARAIGGGCGLTLVASVQEEFNIRGVVPAVRAIQPDLLICLDVAPASDTPDTAHLGEVRLGGGPTIGRYSFHGRGTLNGLIPNPKLVRFVEDVARRRSLTVQPHIFFGGLTDVSYAQLEGAGIPGIDLGIPARYTHSPVEAISLDDLQASVGLIQSILEEIPSGLDLARG
jgi:putative aminopeptidase FrvX